MIGFNLIHVFIETLISGDPYMVGMNPRPVTPRTTHPLGVNFDRGLILGTPFNSVSILERMILY